MPGEDIDKCPSRPELACIYAALILADDDVAITAEKLSTLLKAASVEVEPYWPGLYAKALASCNIKDLVTASCIMPRKPAAEADQAEVSAKDAFAVVAAAADPADDTDSDPEDFLDLFAM